VNSNRAMSRKLTVRRQITRDVQKILQSDNYTRLRQPHALTKGLTKEVLETMHDEETILQADSVDSPRSTTQSLSRPKVVELGYTEFVAATFDRDACCTAQVCFAAFKFFDQDGDGLISKTELSSGSILGDLSSDELLQMVFDLDQNGDGEIDFQEFMDMMRDPGD